MHLENMLLKTKIFVFVTLLHHFALAQDPYGPNTNNVNGEDDANFAGAEGNGINPEEYRNFVEISQGENPGQEMYPPENPGQEMYPPENPGQENPMYPPENPGQEMYPPENPGQENPMYPPENPGQEMYPPENTGQENPMYPPENPGQEMYPPENPGQEMYPPENPGQEMYPPENPGQEMYPPENPGQNMYAPENPGQENPINPEENPEYQQPLYAGQTPNQDCWLTLNAAEHFKAMDTLDETFREVRQKYQNEVGEDLDSTMLQELLFSRGAASRAIHKFGGDELLIPAGINLGGYSMMRLQDSLLVFHRMKLRNSTNFRVNYLHNDLMTMTLTVSLSLNDLHLVGTYERTATHKDPSVLYYRPSFGTIELLLRNVSYVMDARLRMMSDRLTIEVVTSNINIGGDALMSYLNTNLTDKPDYTVRIEASDIDDYLHKMKTDLDLWLKDYFNDFLMFFNLPAYDNVQFQEYEKKKTIMLNEYVSYALNSIRNRVFQLGGFGLRLPKFTLFTVPNMVIRIKQGVLRGLESMYRRSMATGMRVAKLRQVDVIVGFSQVRVEYNFEAILPNGAPPLTGTLTMTANELTAHLGITLVQQPESLDLNFDFIQHMVPESLIVEGPANRLIANFKHQLEHHIIALMSNSLIHYVKMLNTVTRCAPLFFRQKEEDPFIRPGNNNNKNFYGLRSEKKAKAKKQATSTSKNTTKKSLKKLKV